MKIIFVMPFHISESGGGAEVQAWLYSKELAKLGHEVYYLCQSIKYRMNYRENREGVKIIWINQHRYFDFLGAKDFLRVIEDLQPDIIIQRITNYLTGKLSGWVRNKNCRFLWICTDNSIPYKFGLTRKYLKKTVYTFNPYYWIKFIIFLFNSLLNDISKNKGIKKCDIAFTQNDFQEFILLRNFQKKSLRIINGHCIPENQISIKQRFNNKIILWAGNLGTHKRPELFVELAKNMKKLKDIKFIMIGDKSDKKYLPNYLINTPENFQWLGKLSFTDNLKLFDKTSLLINTSISEGFSNTFIQAWMRGIPVITLGVDPDSIIKKYKLGFRAKSIAEITELLDLIINNYIVFKEISDNCLKYSSEKHNLEFVVRKFLKDINLS